MCPPQKHRGGFLCFIPYVEVHEVHIVPIYPLDLLLSDTTYGLLEYPFLHLCHAYTCSQVNIVL